MEKMKPEDAKKAAARLERDCELNSSTKIDWSLTLDVGSVDRYMADSDRQIEK